MCAVTGFPPAGKIIHAPPHIAAAPSSLAFSGIGGYLISARVISRTGGLDVRPQKPLAGQFVTLRF